MAEVRIIFLNSDQEVKEELANIGVDPGGVGIMAPKARFFTLKVTGLSLKAALILKQEMLSKGGDCAVHHDVASLSCEKSDALLMGTKRQYLELARKLSLQPFGLKKLGPKIIAALQAAGKEEGTLAFSQKSYRLDRTLLMGILNVTPDSFSDGGKHFSLADAVRHAQQMIADGADILDVGGESTRPGHTPVPAEEELKRILPVIREIRAISDVPISVDTYKAKVAEKALAAGADMLNDIWGGRRDPEMLRLAAEAGVPICLMHNRAEAIYDNLMDEVTADLLESVELALKAGVKEENIIIDPGIGFGKTPAHSLEVMRRLRELTALGYPLLLGTSRKSMIGKVLDLPVDERLEGTAATVAYGITCGAKIIRVHDVLAMHRVARMTDAMLKGGGALA